VSGSGAADTGLIHFRPRARLIRLLGEELISSEVMALVELVKNAHDADAHRVTVRLRHPGDPAVTSIEVADDGDGMSLDRVLHSWMEPATGYKRQGGRKRRTALGRLPLGEKGVGRFAADKLGAEMELVTRARDADQEVVLRVAWQHFEEDTYLEDIKNQWTVRTPEDVLDPAHGTLIRMRQVRATWDEALVTRVRDGLARLMPAHAAARDFVIVLDCPEYPALAGPVTNQLLESAPHVLRGSVESTGLLRMDDEQTVDLRQADPALFASEGGWRTPVCGPFSLSLHVWDLDAGGATPSTIDRATRAQLRALSGVSIYRDGFRVMPYGERGDDWLELNQRRVNNPTMRVSNNQIVGVVEITQQENPDLRDRTSREGLVETPAYFDLRALVLSALSILEEHRFARRHPESAESRPGRARDELLELLDSARARAQEGTGMLLALQAVERTYQRRQEDQQRRYEYLLRLAGIGLAAERMTQEFSRTLSSARLILRTALNQARTLDVAPQLQEQLDSLGDHHELLDEQLDLMSPLYHASTRELEPLDLCAVAHDVTRILGHHLHEAGIQVRITQEAPVTVRLNRGHLMQVLLILFDNATRALQQIAVDRQPTIRVHIGMTVGAPSMIVADNGPGVQPDLQGLIFAPHFAARTGGRGLGLHVARDLLEDYNATIRLQAEQTLLPGANFLIRFDTRRQTGAPA
jgi:signal transduction histidine kinase